MVTDAQLNSGCAVEDREAGQVEMPLVWTDRRLVAAQCHHQAGAAVVGSRHRRDVQQQRGGIYRGDLNAASGEERRGRGVLGILYPRDAKRCEHSSGDALDRRHRVRVPRQARRVINFVTRRNGEEGGSLTILAPVLVDTGSSMDEVIYEELKATANLELVLDPRVAQARLFPAVNPQLSGTQREDLLLDENALQQRDQLRAGLSGNSVEERQV